VTDFIDMHIELLIVIVGLAILAGLS